MKITDVTDIEMELFRDHMPEHEREKFFGEGTLDDHIIDFVEELRAEELESCGVKHKMASDLLLLTASSHSELSKQVKEKMLQGWLVTGDVFVRDNRIFQNMVKIVEFESKHVAPVTSVLAEDEEKNEASE